MAEKPKEGSRKRTIFDIFTKKAGTYEQALAKGLELGVKEGTVRSWCRTWDKKKVPETPKKERAPKGAPPAKGKQTRERLSEAPKRAEGPPAQFLPHFKHGTRDAAVAHIAAISKRNGLRADAFHVLEEQGKFAVVPAHHKPPAPPPLFKKGDVVFDAYIPNGMATVTGPGPEQTEIKFKHPRPSGQTTDCVSNYYLHKLTPEEIKAQPKPTKIKRAHL